MERTLNRKPYPVLHAVVFLLTACSFRGDDGSGPVVVNRAEITAGDNDIARACGRRPDHLVIINDFAYSPINLQVKVGETVAWVNMEFCGNALVEQSAPLTGCDNHHEVVTFPMIGSDSINSGQICSPVPGVSAPPGLPTPPGFAINPNSCAQDKASNVFCHTFTSTGTQHYTCFTNPGHTLLMNGFITVSE